MRFSVAQFLLLAVAMIILLPLVVGAYNYIHETFFIPPYDPGRDVPVGHTFGHGPKQVLLIHGLAGASNYWSGRLTALEDEFTFHAVDLLGFGDSPKPKGSYDSAMHLKAIRAYLNNNEISPLDTIVAHSMGAVLALALNESLGIPNLILMNPAVFPDAATAKASLSQVSIMHRGMVEESWLLKASCFFRDIYRIPLFAEWFDLPSDVYRSGTRHTWNSLEGSLLNVIINQPRSFAIGDTHLSVIASVDDEVVPFDIAKNFAEQTNAGFVSVPKGGHNFFLSNPQPLIKALSQPRD